MKNIQPTSKNVKRAIVLIGASGAGKDSLFSHTSIPVIKFSKPMKTTLERYFDLPEGSMEDRDFRSTYIIDPLTGKPTKKTYLDLMIEFYEFHLSTMPTMSFNAVKKEWQTYEKDELFIFNDVRMIREAEFILNEFGQDNVFCIHIGRPGSSSKAPDRYIPHILEMFNEPIGVINDGNLNQLHIKANTILKEYFNV